MAEAFMNIMDPNKDDPVVFCNVCLTKVGRLNLNQHVNGKKHQTRLELGENVLKKQLIDYKRRLNKQLFVNEEDLYHLQTRFDKEYEDLVVKSMEFDAEIEADDEMQTIRDGYYQLISLREFQRNNPVYDPWDEWEYYSGLDLNEGDENKDEECEESEDGEDINSDSV